MNSFEEGWEQRISFCITQWSAMIPPSVPKGGELVTHTRSTCTLLHYAFNMFPCSCLLHGGLWCLSILQRTQWLHLCIVGAFCQAGLVCQFPWPAGNTAFSSRGSIRPTSSTSAAHTAGIMQTEKHPNSIMTISVPVCSIYTCIVLVYDYQHASVCINIHVNLWSRSFAWGQISGTAAANSDHVSDRCLFCACLNVWSRIKLLFVYMDLEGWCVHVLAPLCQGDYSHLSFLWSEYD